MKLALVLVLAACEGVPDDLGGDPWLLADDLFHHDPHWLGADLAATVDLVDGRTLWLFGDTFIATTAARTRRESRIVASSVAVMSGRDPETATLDFAWQRDAEPGPFFAPIGDHTLVPMSGVRIVGTDPDGRGGPLVIFLAELAGDEVVGTRVVRIADPSGPPASWVIEPLMLPPPPFAPDALVGTCVAVDGGHLVAISVDGPERNARLVRWPLYGVATGDLAAREWVSLAGWVAEPDLIARPLDRFHGAEPHCSLAYGLSISEYSYAWRYMQRGKYGAIEARDALELAGPFLDRYEMLWLDDESMYDPPYREVLAVQEHPTLVPYQYVGLITYVPSSEDPADLLDPVLEHTLHWPHFMRLVTVSTAVE